MPALIALATPLSRVGSRAMMHGRSGRLDARDAPNGIMKLLKRLLRWLRMWVGPGGGTHHDPFADKLAPVKPGFRPRSGAVAVAEPEDG
jgi:hypothetical protein